MNARIDLPSRDNVINLLDLLERPPTPTASERKTVAQLHTLPRAAARPRVSPSPHRRRASVSVPSMSPVDLVARAARAGALAAVIGAACTVGFALAAGTWSTEQTPWLVAFVGLMAFSFGASLGSLSSLVAQRAVATARHERERG